MTTIETKIAKNGTRLYYVNGKRAGRNIALEAAADNREDNTFTVKYEYKWDEYYVAGAIQSSVVTYDEVVKKLVLSIDEYHGFSVILDGAEIKSFCNKDQAKALVYQIEDAFIAGYAGIKIALDGSVNILSREQIDLGILNDRYTLACQFVQAYVEQGLTQAQAEKLFVTAQADNLDYKAIFDLAAQFKNETVEADINDYAVTTDAQDVATDAELNNAAAAHINEQYEGLKHQIKILSEYYPELTSENVQELYVTKTLGCSLEQEQALINRFLQEHNARKSVKTDNSAADDFKYVFFTFEKGKTYFCSNDVGGKAEVMTLTVIDRSDSMLTGKTADGTRKYKILEAIDSEAVKLHSSFDGDKIYARFEYSDAVKAVPTDNYSRFISEVAAIFEDYDSINDTFGIWSEYGWHESGFSFGHEFCGWFNAEELAVVIEQLKTAIDYGRTEFEFVSKPNLPPRRSYAKYQTVRAANLKDKIARDAQSTNDNVFDLLPTLDELNDVDETSAKLDKTPPVVYSNIIGGLSEKDAFHHFRVGDKSDGDVITFDGDRWCSIHCDTYDAIIRRHDSTEFFIIYRWNDPDGQYQSVEFSVPEDIFFTTMTDRGACSIDTPDLNELLIAELERDIADNNAFIDHLKREELATDYDLSQCRHAYRKKRDRTPDDAAEYKRLLLLKNKATALAVNVIPILRDAIDNLELTQDFYREAKPQDTLSAVADTCAQLNAHAPLGWEIHFDSEHNKFPVEFNGAPVVKLDSLATTKFLSPEDFFDQFRPLVDKNYSELQQFIRDRKDELHSLIQIRYEMADIYGDDSERLKTLDEMIAQVRRDIFHAEIAG